MKRSEAPTQLDLLQRTALRTTIRIRNLITMYYFEHGKNFVFHGEKHDFWEMLYVDRGEVEVQATSAAARRRAKGLRIIR